MESAAPPIELDGQYRALREGAGWLPRDRARLLVKGADAAEYLQGQLTNEIEALPAGQGAYAALLDRKGHLQADMRVLHLADTGEIWLDLDPGLSDGVLNHLRTYSIGRDVEIEDVSGGWALLSVIGPHAEELTGFADLGAEHAQRHRDWDGTEVLGVSTDLGVDLIARADQADTLQQQLSDAGIPGVSEEAAEILRIESGRPRFGLDMGPDHMPAEAAIVERAVNFEKGCYIGQEPVARLHYRGKPNRTLRGLRLSAAAETGQPLLLGEREAGQVGSSCISPALGPIALAIVRREAEVGSELTVGDGPATAEVVELPFTA